MKKSLIFVIFAILLTSLGGANMKTGEENRNNSSLISRDLLFGNPDRITTRISPDGSKLSFLAPKDGVLNVWVGPADSPETAKPVTNDTYRGIRSYTWAYTNQHILYLQDRSGDENWRIYSVNLSSGETRDLTPFEGVRSEIRALSIKHPHEAIIGLNKRDPEYHDLFRLNIETGNMTLILENREFSGFEIDDDFEVRLASNMTADGGTEIFRPAENKSWEPFLKIEMEDALTTGFSGFNKSNDLIYLIDSRGRNTAALYALNLHTKESSFLAEDPKSDLTGMMIHPTEKNVQAVAFYYDRIQWKILDPSISQDIDLLRSVDEGDMTVVSRSLDDKVWIVVFTRDNGPARYYHYDHEAKKASFLFTDREKLAGTAISKDDPRRHKIARWPGPGLLLHVATAKR